jgi:zinc transporter 7
MASRLFPSRRAGFSLIAGCLMFSALAAAKASAGDLSVAEIEEQLQVWTRRAIDMVV